MKPAKGKAAVNKVSKDALKTVNDRKVGKSSKPISKKAGSAKKDPNKPKRPPSAFFVFLEDFRKTFKEKHPNVKGVAAVGKAGGEKWKSMSKSEKAPYEAKAAKKKTEYEKVLNTYNKKQASKTDDADEESEKSKSEVHDDDEESGQEDEEDEEDDDDEEDDEDDD